MGVSASKSSNKPIRSVRRAWKVTLKRAGVSYFPIYNLRHTFYRRLSWVAPECRRAARNAAQQLGNKTDLQLGLVHQVREQLERVNEKSYEGTEPLQFRDNAARTKNN